MLNSGFQRAGVVCSARDMQSIFISFDELSPSLEALKSNGFSTLEVFVCRTLAIRMKIDFCFRFAHTFTGHRNPLKK